MARIRYY